MAHEVAAACRFRPGQNPQLQNAGSGSVAVEATEAPPSRAPTGHSAPLSLSGHAIAT